MAGKSPTQRTLDELRKLGYPLIQVVERWNAFAKIRQDLFGFIDVLAVGQDGGVLAVQATSRDNVASRVAKIAESDSIIWIRKAGWRVEVWGWGRMASGKYELRKVDVS